MTDVTLTLRDEATEIVLRFIATRYATFHIQSTLDKRATVDQPWPRGKFKEWSARVERQRRAYKMTLLSIIADLPPVTVPEWKPYQLTEGSGTKWDGTGRFDPRKNWRYTGESIRHYSSGAVIKIAEAYADQIIGIVNLMETA